MSQPLSALIGQIADEFTERCARGETPLLEEFIQRHPGHADILGQVLPLLLTLDGTSASASEVIPCIPGYEILSELGRGGMGIVYEARETALGRIVALKRILPGLLAGPQSIRRFLAEATVAARLNHPGIVTVHALGEHEGQPFLILERIHGQNLGVHLGGQPQPPRWSADLVRRVALAVNHAHVQGVIHRDLKPSNVLLNAAGEPYLTDFGLARVVDADTSMTGSGTIVGSPSYMAPEQAIAHWNVGPAADVWALGAILYECLTGRPPFVGVDRLDTLLLVRHNDPVPLRRLNPQVPQDLEVITLHCLQREPTQRYPSAQALGDDLACFLEGRPIQARPPGLAGRLWRTVKRHPAITSLAGAVALSTVLGVGGLAWQAHRAAVQRRTAEENFRTARRAVDDCFTLVTEHPSLQGPGMQPAREALLRSALGYYREFLAHRQDDASLAAELGETLFRVGVILAEVGSSEEARDAFSQALELAHDDAQRARNLHHRGMLHLRLEKFADAEGDLRDALQLRDAGDLSGRADTLAQLGMVCRSTRRPAEAEQHLTEAVRLRRSVDAGGLALIHHLLDLSRVLDETKKKAEMRQVLDEAIRLAKELNQQDPDRDDHVEALSRSYQLLGAHFLMHSGRPEELLAAYKQALPYRDQLAVRHPNVVRHQVALVGLLTDLGLAHTLQDPSQTNEALACYGRGRQVIDRLRVRQPRDPLLQQVLADLIHKKAILHGRLGQVAEAEAAYGEASTIHRERLRQLPESNQLRIALANSRMMQAQYAARRDLGTALELFAEAERMLKEVRQTQPDFPRLDWLGGIIYSARASAYAFHQRYAEALPDWERCLLPGNQNRHTGYRMRGLASRARAGQHERAVTEAEKILKQIRSSGPQEYSLAEIWFHAARVFSLAGAAAASDTRIAADERARHANRHAARALEVLHIAERLGAYTRPTNVGELRDDPDFAPLRARAEFQRYLRSLPTPPGT
ncbi:MAG: serine/threonine-protein kinase [Gemmataceae bacterium]